MKRSRSVTLVTMASTTLALAACEEKPDTDGALYRTVNECEKAEFVPDGDCSPLLAEGERIHDSTAPRYRTKSLCEGQHGFNDCTAVPDDAGTYYTPSPVGYFVTGAVAGAVLSNLVRPVYRERNTRKYYMTGGGYLAYRNAGFYSTTQTSIKKYNPTVVKAPPRVQTRTTVASRTGFGSRSGGGGGFFGG